MNVPRRSCGSWPGLIPRIRVPALRKTEAVGAWFLPARTLCRPVSESPVRLRHGGRQLPVFVVEE